MPLPFVGGHEIVGSVAAVGEGVSEREFPIGRKLTARLIQVCGKCYFCRHGEENLCVDINAPFDKEMEIPGTGGLGEYLNQTSCQLPSNRKLTFTYPLPNGRNASDNFMSANKRQRHFGLPCKHTLFPGT